MSTSTIPSSNTASTTIAASKNTNTNTVIAETDNTNTNGNTNNAKKPKRTKKPRSRDEIISKQLSWLLRHGAHKDNLPIDIKGFVQVSQLLQNNKIKSNKATFEDIKRIVANDPKVRYSLKLADELGKPQAVAVNLNPKENAKNNNDSENINTDNNTLKSHVKTKVKDIDNNATYWYICANQGHSLPGVHVDLTDITQDFEEPIIHGTSYAHWELIKKSGVLSRMNRHHIHFAIDVPQHRNNKVISGMRPNADVFIYIDKKKTMEEYGIRFYKSVNQAILSPGDKEGHIPLCCFEKVVDKKDNVLEY